MWEGPLRPDWLSVFLLKQPRPGIGDQVRSGRTRRFPFIGPLYKPGLHWILLNVISDISELPRSSNARVVVAVLPSASSGTQMRACFRRHMAHEGMNELWQRPRVPKC